MLKFDYYVLHTYVPDLDGDGPEVYRKWIEQVSLAEELGFHCAWFTEHHFGRFGGMLPSPQMLMSALSQRTQRIRLGTAVVLMALHHPLRIAEELAMLDILSGGRLEVGVGRGMPNQPYALFGTDPSILQEKLEEQVEMLQAAWTETPFTWTGAYYQCPNPITVRPQPVQRPHPPMWMPANRESSHARWIGRHGFNLFTIPWLMGFDMTRKIIADYRAGLREAGYAEDRFEVLAYLPAYVGETPERARQEVVESWGRFRKASVEERGAPEASPMTYEVLVPANRVIFGDPEMCRQHVARVRDELGVDRLALMFHFGGLSQDRALASMRLFAEEVAPAFAG